MAAPQGAQSPLMKASGSTPQATSAGMGAGMGTGAGMGMDMEDEMEMARAPRRELYPSMMQLPALTPEKRVELESAAHARIANGRTLVIAGVDAMRTAQRRHDFPGLQASAALLREGALKLESGAATLDAVTRGRPPRAIATEWFRSNMGLLPAQDMVAPHGFFGLSWFHYAVMALVLGSLGAMLWMNARKMQRARALALRLVPAARPPEAAAIQSPAQINPGMPPPADAAVARPPSRPNAWTGLLRLEKIFEESPNVRTLRLVEPSGADLPFDYLPGQFVTFTVRPNDKPVKRSYTISSSPTRRGYCEVTVKREARGTVSGYLHDMHEGDTIQVTGPSGSFTFVGDTANSIVLISGGVGITPMMSVVRYLTDRSWRGDIYFIYACRGEEDVIYREELEYLSRRNSNLHLTITASEPTSDAWPYDHGYITRDLLLQAVPYITTRHVHLCGPKPMMDAVKAILAELEVPDSQVATEVFVGKERVPPTAAAPTAEPSAAPVGAAAPGTRIAVARFVRSNQSAMLPAGKTVLEAAEDVGVNIEYSCRAGTCGVCKVKLLGGSVSMDVEDALDEREKKDGIILACQATATADVSIDA